MNAPSLHSSWVDLIGPSIAPASAGVRASLARVRAGWMAGSVAGHDGNVGTSWEVKW